MWQVLDVPIDVEIDGQAWAAQPGEQVWVPCGAVHRMANNGDAPGRLLEIAFGASMRATSSASKTTTPAEVRDSLDLCHRHRLPGCGARGVHGRSGAHGGRGGRRPGQGGGAERGAAPLFEPAWTSCCSGCCRPAGCGSPPTWARSRTPRCTSSAWAPRSWRARTPRTPLCVCRRRGPRAAPARRCAGGGQVDRAGRHRQEAAQEARGPLRRGRRGRAWRGTPSSCARASRSRTPWPRTGSSTACTARPPRRTWRCWTRCMPCRWRPGPRGW